MELTNESTLKDLVNLWIKVHQNHDMPSYFIPLKLQQYQEDKIETRILTSFLGAPPLAPDGWVFFAKAGRKYTYKRVHPIYEAEFQVKPLKSLFNNIPKIY